MHGIAHIFKPLNPETVSNPRLICSSLLTPCSVLGDGPNDQHVSTNDILLAQAACALGPCRRHELQGGKFNKDYAYIALLADHRCVSFFSYFHGAFLLTCDLLASSPRQSAQAT
jgi:hypothetical protein